MPATRLARCLKEGFVYQGEPSPHRGGKLRGSPSADLPPTAFVLFLQNHDQIGNRAFGERLTSSPSLQRWRPPSRYSSCALKYRSFSWAKRRRPRLRFYFSPTTMRNWHRRCEKAGAANLQVSRNLAIQCFCKQIPDPNAAETFERSHPLKYQASDPRRKDLYKRLLGLRRAYIIPRLIGARAIDANAIGQAAVAARWRMGDGATLTLACNLAGRSGGNRAACG